MPPSMATPAATARQAGNMDRDSGEVIIDDSEAGKTGRGIRQDAVSSNP